MTRSRNHIQVDMPWPELPMFSLNVFNAISKRKKYVQLSSGHDVDAHQPQMPHVPNALILSILLQYLFFAIPGASAALYQYFFSAKTYYLEKCYGTQLPKYKQNTLYFKTTEDSGQIQWCSSLQREWKDCHAVRKADLDKCFDNKENKVAGIIVKQAIEKKLLDPPISPTQRVWNTVRPLVRHEKTTYSSAAISVGVGIALAAGVAACCSGFGAPVGVALIFGALAVIGKSCGISLCVVAGSIALSRISSGLYWHRKSAEKTPIDKIKETSQDNDNYSIDPISECDSLSSAVKPNDDRSSTASMSEYGSELDDQSMLFIRSK